MKSIVSDIKNAYCYACCVTYYAGAIPQATFPTRDLIETLRFSSPFDILPAQDPTPTTMCVSGVLCLSSGEDLKREKKLNHGRGWKVQK